MKPPKCRVCGVEHYGHEHVFRGEVPKVSELLANPLAKPVANTVANKKPKYKDLEARKAYMRDYMRKRRGIRAGLEGDHKDGGGVESKAGAVAGEDREV